MKKYIGFLTLIALAALLLTACFGTNNGGDANAPKKTAYNKIIVEQGANADVSALESLLSDRSGLYVFASDDSVTDTSGEIVVGATNRQISTTAKQKLDAEVKKVTPLHETDSGVGYAIYADGGDVACVASNAALLKKALTALTAKLTESDEALADGYTDIFTVSLHEYKRSVESENDEQKYKKIAEALGEETADALRRLNALFDEKLYLWLANLYDPGRLGENGEYISGGFYYSNSARDNYGYLPDIESTWQAISLLKASGMLEAYNNNAGLALPESMKQTIVAFIHSCQSSETGYYYQPQWGSNVSDSREGRDVGWAVNILAEFGEQPLYDTPTGVKGTLGSATSRLSTSTTVAVSSVMPTASETGFSAHLKNKDTLFAYLDGLDWADPTPGSTDGSSYGTTGGVIASVVTQIKAAGLGDAIIEYLDEKQEEVQENLRDAGMEPNGLWDPIVSYDGVNGLMKIVHVYTTCGAEIKYPTEAIESILAIIRMQGADCDGNDVKNVVLIYNPWTTMSSIIINLRQYGNGAEAERQLKYVRDHSAELISISIEKLAKFEKPDGSYGLNVGAVPHTLYGNNVAVIGSIEGDVNGALCATNGATLAIYKTLEVKDFIGEAKVPIYHDSDFDIFLNELGYLTTIDKQPPVYSSSVYDFEDYDAGTAADGLGGIQAVKLEGTVLEVAESPKGAGNVLMFEKDSTPTGDSFTLPMTQVSPSSNCSTLSFRMYLDEVKVATYLFQIKLNLCYNLSLKKIGNEIFLGDIPNDSAGVSVGFNSFGFKIELKRWYDIRIEYYALEENSVITKVYVDDALIAISTNHMFTDRGKNPYLKSSQAIFYSDGTSDLRAYFDDITAELIYKEFDEEE